MTMFRCGGGTGLDICYARGSVGKGNFTINDVRPGKRLLFWFDDSHVTPSSLTVDISESIAETIFNNQNVGRGYFSLVRPKTSTLTGSVNYTVSSGSWGVSAYVFEVPDDLKGIMKSFTGNNTMQDLSELGTPPFHFISSPISQLQEPPDRIQRNLYSYVTTGGVNLGDLVAALHEVYCKESYFTPTWLSTGIGNWIMY